MTLPVHLPVAGSEVSLAGVILLGTGVGVLGGLLGVGGGFILTPMLNVIFGIPYNLAVGSSLSQMAGMSSSATVRHRGLGNVDLRLSVIMIIFGVTGAEFGVWVLEFLKNTGTTVLFGREIRTLDLVMSFIYIVLLALVGFSIVKESLRSLRKERAEGSFEPRSKLVRRIHDLDLAPMISLPASGIERISLWILAALGILMGFSCGLLGVGGGFMVTPCFIYIIGIPTTIAVGTSLSQLAVVSVFGAFRHSLAGNIDPLLVAGMIAGSSVGSQLGSAMTNKIRGATLRLALGLLLFVALLFVATNLAMKFI